MMELRQSAIWKMEGFTNADIAEKLALPEPIVGRKLDRFRRIWQGDQIRTCRRRRSGALWLIRWIMWAQIRVLLSLRYWVTIRGTEEVLRRPGPYLLLPNHPAFIEPPYLLIRLWPTFKMRPMLLETNFESPILRPFAWIIGGILVPDTDRTSA